MVYPIHAMIEFALNPLYTVYASFLVFFYTDTIGVDAGIVGIVILVSNLRPYFKKQGCSLIEINTALDHMHVLFEAPPQMNLANFVNAFKSASSRKMRA